MSRLVPSFEPQQGVPKSVEDSATRNSTTSPSNPFYLNTFHAHINQQLSELSTQQHEQQKTSTLTSSLNDLDLQNNNSFFMSNYGLLQSPELSDFPAFNAIRRRSMGAFPSQKVIVPMQTLQENVPQSTLETSPGSPPAPMGRTVRSASLSSTPSLKPVASTPVMSSSSKNIRATRRMSACSASTASLSSSPGLWEKVLQQNFLNQASKSSYFSSLNNTLSRQRLREMDSLSESLDEKIAITGNMFHKRDDWAILTQVPVDKQNAIHIRLEDEGPYGNDETRCFVLSHFSSLAIRAMKCVVCSDEMPIYDRFPLVNGTLYVSPLKYVHVKDMERAPRAVPASVNNKEQFIYAVCLRCLNGDNEIKCKACKSEWNGASLQIGTLYKYDVFAAMPCCDMRLRCAKCNQQIICMNEVPSVMPFFSSYSNEVECQHCKTVAYHFVKPVDAIYSHGH